MTRNTPVFLAATAFLAAVGLLVGSMSPAQARPIDTRVTSVSQLSDVSPDHWAFDALKSLVEKYDVLEGYPDTLYRGDKTLNRYELAAALNDLLTYLEGRYAQLEAADLETLNMLRNEFQPELDSLKARTAALEARAAAIEAKNEEQDERLTLLEKTQVHGDFSVGAMGQISNRDLSNLAPGTFPDHENTIQAIARLRLNLDVPVKEAEEGSYLGEGKIHTRLIAAAGANGGVGSSPGFAGLSRIAADRSAFNEGFNTGLVSNTNNTNNRLNVYVERLYYTQDIQPGVPVLTDLFIGDGSPEWEATGQFVAGIVPWRDYFDKSAYRGNELTQFQNTALVNIPGLPVNANMAGIGYQMKQGLGEKTNFQLTLLTGSPNTDDVLNTWNVSYEGRLNYQLPVTDDGLDGAFYVGGFHNFSNGATVDAATAFGPNLTARATASTLGAVNDATNNGVYAGMDQELYKGIGVNVGYFYNKATNNSLILNSLNSNNGIGFQNVVANTGALRWAGTPKQAFSAALHVPMEALFSDFRSGDHFGLGYAAIDFAGPDAAFFGQDQDRFEQVMELYYTYYLNDQISFVPSFQLLPKRFGVQANDTSVAFGLRTNITF